MSPDEPETGAAAYELGRADERLLWMTSNTDGAAQGEPEWEWWEESGTYRLDRFVVREKTTLRQIASRLTKEDALAVIADHRKAQMAVVLVLEALDSALHTVLAKTPMHAYLQEATAREIKLTFLAQYHAATEEATRP